MRRPAYLVKDQRDGAVLLFLNNKATFKIPQMMRWVKSTIKKSFHCEVTSFDVNKDVTSLAVDQLRETNDAIQTLGKALNYCMKLPSDQPAHVDGLEAKKASNFLHSATQRQEMKVTSFERKTQLAKKLLQRELAKNNA